MVGKWRIGVGFGLVLASAVLGPLRGERPAWESLLSRHCFGCHGLEKTKGGLNLLELAAQQPLVQNRDRWNQVINVVTAGDMPPEGEAELKPDQRRSLLQALDRELNHFDYSTVDDPGFEPARRLTHREYDRTVSDLFDFSLTPTDRFPPDLTGSSGFENSANTLFLPPSLMERYIAAAERVVATVFASGTEGGEVRAKLWKLAGREPPAGGTAESDARALLEAFLWRAYRRSPTERELAGAMDLYRKIRSAGEEPAAFETAVLRVVQSALIAPQFLLRLERGRSTEEPWRVTDHELAARLSYFLWASLPDDELFVAAKRGGLHDSETLRRQVERMLRDPKSEALGSLFAAQWLGFRYIGNRVRLDPIDNPWCTDTLMNAMRRESELFFASLVRDNGTLDDFIDARHTYLNEELAREIYDIEDVRGPEMRKYRLQDPNRGGILTHGSLMAITSNYKETSPIKRGNWILETLLGRPLPPPPPNAGAFSEEVEEDDSLTFRQKVELHSSRAQCRSCHSLIDPLGFSLENFDYFGRWRDSYRVRVVERRDREVLSLTEAMRSLAWQDLDERIADLDSGPKERRAMREQLQALRQANETVLELKLTKEYSPARQNRLIRLLRRLDIDPENSELSALFFQAIEKIRELPQERLDARIDRLEPEPEERSEIAEVLWEFHRLPEEDLVEELARYEVHDRRELLEFFERLGLLEGGIGGGDESRFLRAVALRRLATEELEERLEGLEVNREERKVIAELVAQLRAIPEAELAATIENERDEATEDLIAEVLVMLDPEAPEESSNRRGRPRFERKTITGEATLPDGTPFQGSAGLRRVLLAHHRDDLSRQMASKMLAYALGRQLEYYDEPSLRLILKRWAGDDYRLHSLIYGVVESYPFQYKKNPESKPSL